MSKTQATSSFSILISLLNRYCSLSGFSCGRGTLLDTMYIVNCSLPARLAPIAGFHLFKKIGSLIETCDASFSLRVEELLIVDARSRQDHFHESRIAGGPLARSRYSPLEAHHRRSSRGFCPRRHRAPLRQKRTSTVDMGPEGRRHCDRPKAHIYNPNRRSCVAAVLRHLHRYTYIHGILEL